MSRTRKHRGAYAPLSGGGGCLGKLCGTRKQEPPKTLKELQREAEKKARNEAKAVKREESRKAREEARAAYREATKGMSAVNRMLAPLPGAKEINAAAEAELERLMAEGHGKSERRQTRKLQRGGGFCNVFSRCFGRKKAQEVKKQESKVAVSLEEAEESTTKLIATYKAQQESLMKEAKGHYAKSKNNSAGEGMRAISRKRAAYAVGQAKSLSGQIHNLEIMAKSLQTARSLSAKKSK
jgi:hypothetical protein